MSEDENRAYTRNHRKILWRLAPFGFILAALALFFLFGLHRLVSIDRLIEERATLRAAVDAHFLKAALIYGAAYAMLTATAAPGASLMSILAGALFGAYAGAPIALMAATTGAVCFFVAARFAFGVLGRRPWSDRIQNARAGFQRNSVGYLLFLRISPFAPAIAVNLTAALGGARLVTFVWTTLVGLAPISIVYASAGAGLERLIETRLSSQAACLAQPLARSEESGCLLGLSLSAIVPPQTFGGLLALAALALALAVFVRSRRRALEDDHGKTRP